MAQKESVSWIIQTSRNTQLQFEQANDTEDVYVGRIRSQEIQGDTWISLWIVADNVYGKGAALNAVQILENLVINNKLC